MGLFKKKRKVEVLTPTEPMDKVVLSKAFKSEFSRHLARKHTPCRWYCMATAASFHMHNAMSCAFDRLGCGSLLRMNYPSFPALTAEFLSTLTHEIGSRDEDGTISFQLGNERREVSRT